MRILLGRWLLLGDHSLHVLGTFLLVDLDALAQEHFTDLGNTPRFAIGDGLKLLFQFWGHTECHKTLFGRHTVNYSRGRNDETTKKLASKVII